MLEKILCEKLDGVEMEMREDEDDSKMKTTVVGMHLEKINHVKKVFFRLYKISAI